MLPLGAEILCTFIPLQQVVGNSASPEPIARGVEIELRPVMLNKYVGPVSRGLHIVQDFRPMLPQHYVLSNMEAL